MCIVVNRASFQTAVDLAFEVIPIPNVWNGTSIEFLELSSKEMRGIFRRTFLAIKLGVKRKNVFKQRRVALDTIVGYPGDHRDPSSNFEGSPRTFLSFNAYVHERR